jgi:hypothetical protein
VEKTTLNKSKSSHNFVGLNNRNVGKIQGGVFYTTVTLDSKTSLQLRSGFVVSFCFGSEETDGGFKLSRSGRDFK